MANSNPEARLAIALEIVKGASNGNFLAEGIWHPLGFLNIKIKYDREVVRLHIWNTKTQSRNSNLIHNHHWDLHSYVICGTLRNITYQIVDECYEQKFRINQVEYHGLTNRIIPTNRVVSVQIHSVGEYSPGEFYRIDAGVFHCSELVANFPIATLVFEESVWPRQPEILCDESERHVRVIERQACSPQELSLNLGLVIECISVCPNS